MRRSLFITVLATLLAIALLAPAATAKSDGKKHGHSEKFTLYAVEDEGFVTITREGDVLTDEEEESSTPDPGDRFVGTETVYSDEDRTDEVGRNHIECTVTESFGEFPTEEPAQGEEIGRFGVSFVCAGVLDLYDQGTLSWSGVTGFSSEDFVEEPDENVPFIDLAINGGTDELIGSSGQATIFEEAGNDEEEVLSRYEVELLKSKRGR